jgi:hypothetical protein
VSKVVALASCWICGSIPLLNTFADRGAAWCLQDNEFQFIPNRSVKPGFKLDADKTNAE